MFGCLEETLNLEMKASKTVLHRLLAGATQSKPPRSTIRSLRQHSFDEWGQLAKLETLCTEYFGTLDTTKKDSIGQLSFQHEALRSLNHIPFILIGLSLFKIYLVPAMAIFMPVLAFILPFLIIRCIYKIQMTLTRYIDLIKGIWFGSKDTSYIQIAFFVFSLLQGLIQPIQNAIHYHTSDTIIYETGATLIQLRAYCIKLRTTTDFHVTRILDEFPVHDPRRCFALVFESPTIITTVFENLGHLEVLWKVAHTPCLKEVTFIESGDEPYLEVDGLQDLSIPVEKRVLSSIQLDKTSHHCLVTGPNGGGKSSAMRAILQSVVIAQTFGVAAVNSMTLRPFKWISSGLSLHDTPGIKSMFQTEVQFAARLLRKRKGPGLILYDELFHSTNPPDCVRTANIFMRQLWKRKNIASFLSTHVFELVETAPPEIQRLCVSAIFENKKLRFLYKLTEGVCKVSSVFTILKREGLAAAKEDI